MKISRHGTDAFHGVSSIELKSPSFEWYEPGSSLQICSSRVKDFSTTSHHSYTAHLTVREINHVLEALAKAAMKAPATFESALAPSLKAIIQLQSVVAGVRAE